MRSVSESFHYSKDAGFKVVSHMMPDLPNVDYERDVEQFIVSIPVGQGKEIACWKGKLEKGGINDDEVVQYTVILCT